MIDVIKENKEKPKICLIWLRDVTIKPILIVLIVALLDKPIVHHLNCTPKVRHKTFGVHYV